jgi:NAD+ synthase (glutamine-hydrolysing)
MKIALAQLDFCVGDIENNTEKIIDAVKQAEKRDVDLIVFSELALTGYPPEDLLFKPGFVSDNLSALKKIVKAAQKTAVYLGFVDKVKNDLYNAGAFIEKGKIKAVHHKNNLPNYGVFDEKRYFVEGKKCTIVSFKGKKIGLGICEDIWVGKGPYIAQAKKGAEIILNINASPFYKNKIKERESLLVKRAKETKSFIVYVNQVGGQDELVFDGGSMVVSSSGKILAKCMQFNEEVFVFDTDKKEKRTLPPYLSENEEIHEALVLGIRDYVRKNNFSKVIVGLSGGIDSALTLYLAVQALGSKNVISLFMPSKYTSERSLNDALQLIDKLQVKMEIVNIDNVYSQFLQRLSPFFKDKKVDVTEENLQARIRGSVQMAFSNKFGYLVLTTGNKSETSVGYCTLYGDTAGGFNVLKDVLKTKVYQLANWINRNEEIILRSIIKRPPTAELRPDQCDQDTLPPYNVLDKIISAYVEKNKSAKQIIASGIKKETVEKTIRMIDKAEYKRRQAPPGPRITKRAFGKDWRVPITNLYKG